MGNRFGNGFLEQLGKTVLNQEWLQELYAKDNKTQRAELHKLFVEASASNNVSSGEKKSLESRAEVLADKVERLEAKMAVLAEQMAAKQEQIDKEAKEILDLVTQAEDKSEEMADEQKIVVQRCIDDVFVEMNRGIIGPDAVVPEIRRRIEGNSVIPYFERVIGKILGNLDSKEAEVQGLVAQADRWMQQKKILQAQYGSTKTAYDMLNVTVSQIGATETSYQNIDLNTDKPIYSPEKAAILASYAEEYAANPTNTSYDPNSSGRMKREEFFKKYTDLGVLDNKRTSGVDSVKIENKAMSDLGKALEANLFEDMKKAGFTRDEVVDFFVQYFSSAGFYKEADGTLVRPIAHDGEAQGITAAVKEGILNYNTGFLGTENTWDENAGNTISSNNQLASLQKFIAEGKLAEMGKNFTFKEAMFALFGENGLFKDCGISYDLNKQDKLLNYSIDFAGDEETAAMFEKMKTTIFDNWGVKPHRGINDKEYELPPEDEEPSETPEDIVKDYDPIWFNLGDNKNEKYSFIIDRNNDGKFSNKEEFVGANGETNWLEDMKSFDTNNDGVLSGDELKNVRLLGTNYSETDRKYGGDAYTPGLENTDNKYYRENETQINYTLTTAEELGIKSIDLSQLSDADVGNRTQWGEDKIDAVDANGSKIFNDTFKIEMEDGSTIDAHRQDDKGDFMDKVYGAAMGKSFTLGGSENDFEEIADNNFGKFETLNKQFANMEADIQVLRSAGDLADEARALYQDTLDGIDAQTDADLTRAANKAASYKAGYTDWSSIRQEVFAIARQKGIAIPEEQAKGIYVLDASLDAEGVVNRYIEQQNERDLVDANKANRKQAWSLIIEAAKMGAKTNADDIMAMLKEGKSTQEILDILKATVPEDNLDVDVTELIGFDSEREQELYEAFNNYFEQNHAAQEGYVMDDGTIVNDPKGIVVKALAQFSSDKLKNPNFMSDASAEQIAQHYLENIDQYKDKK